MFTAFDEIAKQAFDAVTEIFGESAVWHSPGGDMDGRILFNSPDEPEKIGDSETYEYQASSITAEYMAGTFTGLKESTDAGSHEYITARGEMFLVLTVKAKFDGQTFVAYLERHQTII